jgi:hypothetical protein
MIEWVPINDFEFLPFTSYLVAYKDDQGNGVGLIHHRPECDRYFYAGKKISYAAYINFPVEKTLEDKFVGYYESMNGKEYTVGSMLKCLSEIAKEHYEGKE